MGKLRQRVLGSAKSHGSRLAGFKRPWANPSQHPVCVGDGRSQRGCWFLSVGRTPEISEHHWSDCGCHSCCGVPRAALGDTPNLVWSLPQLDPWWEWAVEEDPGTPWGGALCPLATFSPGQAGPAPLPARPPGPPPLPLVASLNRWSTPDCPVQRGPSQPEPVVKCETGTQLPACSVRVCPCMQAVCCRCVHVHACVYVCPLALSHSHPPLCDTRLQAALCLLPWDPVLLGQLFGAGFVGTPKVPGAGGWASGLARRPAGPDGSPSSALSQAGLQGGQRRSAGVVAGRGRPGTAGL